jgi:hypothetical protein
MRQSGIIRHQGLLHAAQQGSLGLRQGLFPLHGSETCRWNTKPRCTWARKDW